MAGWQHDHDRQWDGVGAMDGTMGGEQLLRTQKRRNERRCKIDSSGNHNGQRWHDHNGWRQRQLAMAAQWVAGWQSNAMGHGMVVA